MNEAKVVEGELERRIRVADMLVTCHCIMEQNYRRLDTIISISLMVFSLAIVLLSVISPWIERVRLFSLEISVSLVATLASIVVLTISIVEWKTAWKSLADRHAEAAREWSTMKLELLGVKGRLSAGEAVDVADKLETYDRVGRTLVKIPDRNFLKLKQLHKRKVLVSSWLDRYPYAPLFVLKWKAMRNHSIRAGASD